MSIFKKISNKLFPQAPQWGKEHVDLDSQKMTKKLDENIAILKTIFGETSDIENQNIVIGQGRGIIFYIKSMVDRKDVNDKILQPLTDFNLKQREAAPQSDLGGIRGKIFPGLTFHSYDDFKDTTWDLLNGYVLLMVEGEKQAYLFAIANSDYRAITEPTTQTIIRGPKDSFTESLQTGYSLIRRRIRNPRLQFEEFIVGEESKTTISIAYMKGIVDEGILAEARKRVQAININIVLDSGNIEETISDQSYSPFPLIFNTERPDTIAGGIMEGKVAFLVEGSPFVLLAPTVLTDFFQSPEDYYQSFLMGSFIRTVRYISFMVALLFPAFYVALTTYHHELIPTNLLISIQSQREGVPFPAVVEILIMELTFEVLREAGVRMPRAVGQTVSIVGALVLGQAVVEAGLVSNVLVIVVAFTAIASFVSPIYNFSVSTRLLKFVFILAASVIGLYGVLLTLVIMVAHLVSLRSFGVPYMAPIAPFLWEDQGDVYFRLPNWSDLRNPSYLKSHNHNKGKMHVPTPPNKGEGS